MLGIGGTARFIISRTMQRREAYDAAFSTAAAGLLFGDRLALLLGADASSFADTAICLKVVLLFARCFSSTASSRPL